MSKASNRHNHFKNSSCYYEWRAHWRFNYKRLSKQIQALKERIKYGDNPRVYQGALACMRCEAHAMMIAREAVTEQYKANHIDDKSVIDMLMKPMGRKTA